MIVNQKIINMSERKIVKNKLLTGLTFVDDIINDTTETILVPNFETNFNNDYIMLIDQTPFKVISTSNNELAFISNLNFLDHELAFIREKGESINLSTLIEYLQTELVNWQINNLIIELDTDIVITQYLGNSEFGDNYISTCNFKDVIINLIKSKNLKYNCTYSIKNNEITFNLFFNSSVKKVFTTSSYIKNIQLPNIDYDVNLVHYKYYYKVGTIESSETFMQEEFGYLQNDGTIIYGAAARSNAPNNIKLEAYIEQDTAIYATVDDVILSPSLQDKIEDILLNSTNYEISFYDYKNDYAMGETLHFIHEGKKYITQVTGIEYNEDSKKIICGNNRIDLLFSIKKGKENGTY